MSELEWPPRWSESTDAPPLARDFVEGIERPVFVPPPVRRSSPPQMPRRWIAAGVAATALVLGGAVVWRFAPRREASVPPLTRVTDPVGHAVQPEPVEITHRVSVPAVTEAAGASDAEVRTTEGPAAALEDRPDGDESASRTDVAPRDERHGSEPIPPSHPTPTSMVPARLHLSSVPWTEIEIDGVPRGATPLRASDLAPGDHVIRFVREELGIDETRTVHLVAGETTRMAVRLEVTIDESSVTDASRYDAARTCAISGEHACVIRLLLHHAVEAREYELLIGSMRAHGGYDRELVQAMRAYLMRFPSGRQAAAYRQYLVAHAP